MPKNERSDKPVLSEVDANQSRPTIINLAQCVEFKDNAIALLEASKPEEGAVLLEQLLPSLDTAVNDAGHCAIVIYGGLAMMADAQGQLEQVMRYCEDVKRLSEAATSDLPQECRVSVQIARQIQDDASIRLGRAEQPIERLRARLAKTPSDDLSTAHMLLEKIAVLQMSQRDYSGALATVAEGRTVLRMEWDKQRARPQWDQIERTIQSRTKNT